MCAFSDIAVIDPGKNKKDFIKNLPEWKKLGIDLITIGLQGPSPFKQYYKKARERDRSIDISFKSSALNSDGSLNKNYFENIEEIIESAGKSGLYVLLNVLSASCEDIFEDEFAVINGIFNVTELLLEKKFPDIFVNITDISNTFYKSSVLNGDKFIKLLQSVKEKVNKGFYLGAGIKTFSGVSEKNILEYIKLSDFIPVYENQTQPGRNTKNILEKIYYFKEKMRETGVNIPIIVIKGDDLSEKYNSYGKNNMAESLENGASWCYYDIDGFVIPENHSINWSKDSSIEKKRFFEVVEKYKFKQEM